MALIEIYRSAHLANCEQRALVLDALGIPAQIVADNGAFALLVPEEARPAALGHLAQHEEENRPVTPPPPEKPLAKAWLGSAGYAAAMLLAALAASAGLAGVDWYEAGAMRGSFLHSGEWWRTVTALTLHADVGHFAANLAFGVFFGYFAGQMLGPGVAWLSILVAATLGNLLNGVLMPLGRSSLGASTAVFATLGLVAAYSWRRRSVSRMRWTRRWAPLIAGIALLGFTGAGGENTDVLAHAAGFACGVLAGAAHARWPLPRLADERIQAAAGAIAFAILIAAWASALLGS